MKKILFLLLICVLVMSSGCSIKKNDEMSNAEKFASEYSIEEDNPFEYISYDELKDIFDSGDGIVFFGNSDCEWCLESANVLYSVLVNNNVDKVYYINPSTLSYDLKDELLGLINEEIEDIEILNIKMPCLYIIKDGVVIDYCDYSLEENSSDEVDIKDNKKKLRKKYLKLIELYKEHIA